MRARVRVRVRGERDEGGTSGHACAGVAVLARHAHRAHRWAITTCAARARPIGHKNVVYAIAFNNPFGDKIVRRCPCSGVPARRLSACPPPPPHRR
jgi:hypothetical protein